MLLTRVKTSIELKTKAKYKLPTDDVLQDMIQEATIYVANRCDPAELERNIIEGETILKHIENGQVIIEPEYPDFTNIEQHLQIDEALSYAVINQTCFLLTADAMYKQLADEDIAIYRCDYSRVGYGD